MIISFLIVLLVIFIAFSAIMSASETSLFSLSYYQLNSYQTSSDKKEKIIATLLQHPRDLLVTILILNVFSNILIQNTVSNLFGTYGSWLLKVGVPLLLTLFLGEVIPKSLALPNNTKVARFVCRFIYMMKVILMPIRKPLTKITTFISRFLFFFLKKEKPISTSELEHILLASKKEGVLTSDEFELTWGYLDLKNALVKEKMRPKNEIIFFDISSNLNNLKTFFMDKQVTRIPVCQDEIDNLLGVISVETFILNQERIHTNEDLKKFLNKPFFIPENTKAWNLLWLMREKKTSLALVVDEYGMISGIISQEDMIESVIGEIEDPHDEMSHYHREDKNIVIANGDMTLEEFEDVFFEKLLSPSNMVTIGGWLLERFGDIPQAGEKFVYKDYLFYVLDANPKRVKKVYIRRRKMLKKGRRK